MLFWFKNFSIFNFYVLLYNQFHLVAVHWLMAPFAMAIWLIAKPLQTFVAYKRSFFLQIQLRVLFSRQALCIQTKKLVIYDNNNACIAFHQSDWYDLFTTLDF